ncbi:hypothetical protein ACIG3E_23080 [Streptomyces sp. NPDC053474]|uniref:hypothetical protein n=1 Tax=Streptomyces sp. NPDC053474 TaxID=3365704 RepID=UPI0037D68B14
MTAPGPPRFPPHPLRGVRVLHQRRSCAPQFAGATVDVEPAAAGIEEQPRLPGHGIAVALRVVPRGPAPTRSARTSWRSGARAISPPARRWSVRGRRAGERT